MKSFIIFFTKPSMSLRAARRLSALCTLLIMCSTLYAEGWVNSPLSHPGMNDAIETLTTDGSGNLYAGGAFTTAGGMSADHIAK